MRLFLSCAKPWPGKDSLAYDEPKDWFFSRAAVAGSELMAAGTRA